MDFSALLMIAYLAALFLKHRFLWTITGILAVLALIGNVITFFSTFSLMAAVSAVFCFLIASQAAAMSGGIDVIGWLKRKFGGRR